MGAMFCVIGPNSITLIGRSYKPNSHRLKPSVAVKHLLLGIQPGLVPGPIPCATSPASGFRRGRPGPLSCGFRSPGKAP